MAFRKPIIGPELQPMTEDEVQAWVAMNEAGVLRDALELVTPDYHTLLATVTDMVNRGYRWLKR